MRNGVRATYGIVTCTPRRPLVRHAGRPHAKRLYLVLPKARLDNRSEPARQRLGLRDGEHLKIMQHSCVC